MGISNNISWKLIRKEILNPDLEFIKLILAFETFFSTMVLLKLVNEIIEYIKQFKNVAAITECVMQ